MAIRDIVRLGNESLVQPSVLVDLKDPEIGNLVQDMHDTMKAHKAIGLAAPQIGVNKRVIIFGGMGENARSPERQGLEYTVLFNPEIKATSLLKADDWEACVSLPGLRGLVPRYKKIRYWGLNLRGEHVEYTAEDFHARVVQHEVDHLNGILYPMRMKNFAHFGFDDVIWERLTGEPYQAHLDHQKTSTTVK